MPAKSKAQQRFMGMVHAAQKGELDNPSAEVEKAADSMSDADAKDYASTKHKGLPNHVRKENMEKELKEIIRQTYRESLRESINEDATELPQATIPSSVKIKLQMAIDKIKDSKLSNNAKLQLVAQVVDALDVDKTQLSTIANKIRAKMESVNEIKKLPNGNFSIKKGYPTFADYEKHAKVGDTILKFDKRGGMIKTFVNGSELHQNAKKYLSKVHSIANDKINLSFFGKQGYASVPDYEKKEVGVLVLESKVNEAAKIEPKDDWGVRLVIAIDNNVSALHTSVIREKQDINKAVDSFGTMLKNAIKETLKHKYKPHPKAKDADNQIKTFISELKKFEKIVDIVISKPTKIGINKLDDAWRNIWNHKYGAKIALSGDLYDSIIEGVMKEAVSYEAMGIAKWTNTRQEAVQKFIDDNNLDAQAILKDVTKGKLPERVRFIQALVGTPNNSSFKWYVKNYANESVVREGKKAFKVNPPIGKAKYSISSHNGSSTHNDGSDFWDIKIFKNKVDLEKGIKDYKSKGFIEESLIKEDIKSDINKFLDKLNKQFPEQEYTTDFKGGKYARITHQSRKFGNPSAWGFVAMEDNPSKGFKKGDLLKAAGFNTPAKGARGNILDGTAKYDKYSPVYLRGN